jgi:hypothetical protein
MARRILLALAPAAGALLLSACIIHQQPAPDVVVVERGHGPPPHAPAHGYRYKHDDVDLVFDSGMGVYVVVGWPDTYWQDGHYFRLHGSDWQVSARIAGPWALTTVYALPPGLARARGPKVKEVPAKHDEGHGRGHGKH